MDDYRQLKDTLGLAELVGERVALVGRVAEIPWQHMIGQFETHPQATYLDVGDDQLVICTQGGLEAEGDVEVRGEVVKISGRSKRPGSTQTHTEYHIRVDAWTPVRR